jgi:hypothetical protein
MAFASKLLAAAQVRIEPPSVLLLIENVAVDGLMADAEGSLQAKVVGYLLGTPLFF